VDSHNNLDHWSTIVGRMVTGGDLSRSCVNFGGGASMDGGTYVTTRAGTGSVGDDLDCYRRMIQEK
tara:strand:- start:2069 stop:2266 length:198 start_codon:yes stop_codon:yes gene_type:complete